MNFIENELREPIRWNDKNEKRHSMHFLFTAFSDYDWAYFHFGVHRFSLHEFRLWAHIYDDFFYLHLKSLDNAEDHFCPCYFIFRFHVLVCSLLCMFIVSNVKYEYSNFDLVESIYFSLVFRIQFNFFNNFPFICVCWLVVFCFSSRSRFNMRYFRDKAERIIIGH